MNLKILCMEDCEQARQWRNIDLSMNRTPYCLTKEQPVGGGLFRGQPGGCRSTIIIRASKFVSSTFPAIPALRRADVLPPVDTIKGVQWSSAPGAGTAAKVDPPSAQRALMAGARGCDLDRATEGNVHRYPSRSARCITSARMSMTSPRFSAVSIAASARAKA